jgi:ABC-type sugar transport system permease subunit
MIMFPVYVVFPIFQSIWISFIDWDGLGPKTWVGLRQLRRPARRRHLLHIAEQQPHLAGPLPPRPFRRAWPLRCSSIRR